MAQNAKRKAPAVVCVEVFQYALDKRGRARLQNERNSSDDRAVETARLFEKVSDRKGCVL